MVYAESQSFDLALMTFVILLSVRADLGDGFSLDRHYPC